MKVTIEVNYCTQCPHCVFVEDDMGPWDRHYCKLDVTERSLINPGSEIPDWCPIKNGEK